MLLASAAGTPFKMFTFLLSLLTVIGLGTGATQPGFEARITPSGLKFLSEIGIRELKDWISKFTFPDQSGSVDVLIFFTVHYAFSNVHVTSFYIPSASISTKTDVGVTVSVRGLSLAMTGNWKYDWHGPISDDGTFYLSFSDVSLAVTIEIGVDSKTGLPTVHSSWSDCSFYVGSTSVHIYGGASWLYNLFDGVIEDDIQDYLYGQVCRYAINEVNTDLARAVARIRMVTSLGNTAAEIDYSLVSAPTFDASVTTYHKGEVYQIGNHTEAPFKIPTIPSDTDVSRMVFMWMTDYVANSAGYVLHNTGFLQYNVTQDKIPARFNVSLNTSEFAITFLIPQIAKLYPNMMMQLNLNTTAPPVVSITPDNVGATINGDIAAYVIQPNETLAYVFTLGATLRVSAELGFNQSSLTWNSSYVSADLKLLHSAIDDFRIDSLRTRFQFACKHYIIPKLNEFGAQGIPVPSFDDYVFMNSVVTQGQGFLKIGTDLAFKPNGF